MKKLWINRNNFRNELGRKNNMKIISTYLSKYVSRLRLCFTKSLLKKIIPVIPLVLLLLVLSFWIGWTYTTIFGEEKCITSISLSRIQGSFVVEEHSFLMMKYEREKPDEITLHLNLRQVGDQSSGMFAIFSNVKLSNEQVLVARGISKAYDRPFERSYGDTIYGSYYYVKFDERETAHVKMKFFGNVYRNYRGDAYLDLVIGSDPENMLSNVDIFFRHPKNLYLVDVYPNPDEKYPNNLVYHGLKKDISFHIKASDPVAWRLYDFKLFFGAFIGGSIMTALITLIVEHINRYKKRLQ